VCRPEYGRADCLYSRHPKKKNTNKRARKKEEMHSLNHQPLPINASPDESQTASIVAYLRSCRTTFQREEEFISRCQKKREWKKAKIEGRLEEVRIPKKESKKERQKGRGEEHCGNESEEGEMGIKRGKVESKTLKYRGAVHDEKP
jgi:hypothetical protein